MVAFSSSEIEKIKIRSLKTCDEQFISKILQDKPECYIKLNFIIAGNMEKSTGIFREYDNFPTLPSWAASIEVPS